MLRDQPPRADGGYVLYWMVGARRPTWNFALDRAVDWADELHLPLVVFEGLRCDYAWASDRFHGFVADGMHTNARAFESAGITYYPYLEPAPGARRELLDALASRAALIVTDHTPVFDLATLVDALARRVTVRVEAIDGYGIVPLDAPADVFPTAYAFRRYLQRSLRDFLPFRPRAEMPAGRDRRVAKDGLEEIERRWRPLDVSGREPAVPFNRFPIDHAVRVTGLRGGETAARMALASFVSERLGRYGERAHPDSGVASGLSPYLHFGHLSPHEVLHTVLAAEEWSPDRLAASSAGRRDGWWGVSAPAESFLDQVVTWRELGGNATRRADYASYEALPAWARDTLARHQADPRAVVYTLDGFAAAATHDPVWNAAQRELREDGRLHNYMRMLWGKKVLEWTRDPRDAFNVMVELNNRYALDGRDPNSYSGISWVLGRYDRPWGPERPIFGTVRYMTSDSAVRKLHLDEYLRRYGESRLF